METNLVNISHFGNYSAKKIDKKDSLEEMKKLAEYGKTLPPIRKLFGNYILENSAIIFPSERGIGKTLMGLQWCIAIAYKFESFLNEKIEVHGNTLFYNAELSVDTISRRLAIQYDYIPDLYKESEFRSYVFTTRNSLEESLNEFIEIAKTIKPVLIVIDNFRVAFLNSDTNSNKDAAQAMQLLLSLKDDLKTTLVITDHTRKHTKDLLTDSDLQAGSGVKSDLVDSDIFLRRSKQHEQYRILKRVKSRFSSEADGAKLISLNPETLWFEFIADGIDEADHISAAVKPKDTDMEKDLAKELSNSGNSCQKIAEMLGHSKSTIHRWINQ